MLARLLVLSLIAARPPSKIAVLDLEFTGVDKSVAETTGLLLPTEVRKQIPTAQIIGAREIATMVGFERQRQLLGCSATAGSECLAEIGNALGVDEILAGKLGRVDQVLVLELRRIDVVHSRPLGSVTRVVQGSASDLLHEIPGAVAELFGRAQAVPTTPPLEVHREHASAAPAWATWTTVAGSVVLAAGAAGIVWGNVVAGQIATQQSPGAVPTVTRAQARSISTLYDAALGAAAVGVAAAGVGIGGLLFAKSPAVSWAPLPGGAAVALEGRF